MTTYRLDAVDGDRLSIGDAAESWRYGDLLELRPPTIEEVQATAAALSRDEARQLLDLIARYPAFVPSLSDDQRDELLLELLTTSIDDVVPWELALALEVDAARRVRPFLERVLTSGRHRTHRDRVVALLSSLLDHSDARPIAVAVMRSATDDAAHSIVEEMALDRDVKWP